MPARVERVGDRRRPATSGTMTATLPAPTASQLVDATAATDAAAERVGRLGARRSAAGRRPARTERGGVRSGAATREHPGGQRHVRRRDAVADGELGAAGRPAVGQVVEDLVPARRGPTRRWPGRCRRRSVIEPLSERRVEHPQLHRREVLRLVDDDVAVGADLVVVAVRACARARRRAAPGPRRAAGRRRWCTATSSTRLDAGPVQRRRSRRRSSARAGGRAAAARCEPNRSCSSCAGREHRPHPLERLAHLGRVRAAGRAPRRRRASSRRAARPAPRTARLDEAAAGVVGAGPAAGVGDDALRSARR